MCKVSIVVPMYNGEKTIGRCLDSLIAQKLNSIEIVVVNDGSKDTGEDIVREYMKKDERIRLVSQKNAGLGAARNKGIQEAVGEYVGFVDCDDFADAEMFSSMLEAIESTGVSVAICQEKNVYLEGDEIQFINETQFPINRNTVYTNKEILQWLLNYSYMSLNSMCYKLIKRNVFIDHNIKVPEQYRHAEDLVTSIGILSMVERVVIIPKSLYYYVHDKGSLTYAYSLRHAQDVYLDWSEAMEYLQTSNFTGCTDNFSLGMYFTSLKQLQWVSNKEEKRTAAAKELKEKWKTARHKGRWRPDFKSSDMVTPFAHKVKVYVAYFRVCRPVLAIIKLLSWIPFFKYMA